MPKSIAQIIAEKMAEKSGRAKLLKEGSKGDVQTVIPTGLAVLDNYILGTGGWACGRIHEVYGAESSGKTSLALRAVVSAQEMGLPVWFGETERTLERGRCITLGVNEEEMVLTEPRHWGEVQEDMGDFIDALPDGHPALVVLDTIAATKSSEEDATGLAQENKRDVRAKGLSQFMRKVTVDVSEKQVCYLMLNQIRDNVGVAFGANVVTPGGWAVKFHATTRIHIRGGAAVKGTAGNRIGFEPIVFSAKNKLHPPFKQARVRFLFDSGWDDDWSTLKLAKDLKLIKPATRKVETAVQALIKEGIFQCQSN